MGPEPAAPAGALQPEFLDGVEESKTSQLKDKICSDIRKAMSKNIGTYVNDLAESMRSAVLMCNKLLNDVEIMQESATTTINSIKETKDNIPGQITPLATTSAAKALLESSKEQKLPPHLVNRLLSRKSLTNGTQSRPNYSRLHTAVESRNPFSIEAPPLPKYTPPETTLNIGGNIVLCPMQPPLILSASATVGGISIVGRLDQSSTTMQFQPANVYYLYSYSPSEGDAVKIQLGIAWNKIAVITATNLPLSFVAVNLPPKSVHFFALQGVDALGRAGEWSNIVKAIVN